ncbi:MAG: thiamine phosphate synthase [Oscillospiraceae bacterium]|nr:thiamine phosphate synthase [Oscillospiraceae bacterium]
MPNEIAVTNRLLCAGDFLEQIKRVAEAKPTAILLREKDLSEAAYLALAREVKAVCDGQGVPLVAHRFCRAARELGLLLHQPYQSVHSVDEALRAEKLGARYLTFGHVFPTACKPGLPPRGLDMLRAVCEAVSTQVYAIGGITAENAGLCVENGAAGICRMSYWMGI